MPLPLTGMALAPTPKGLLGTFMLDLDEKNSKTIQEAASMNASCLRCYYAFPAADSFFLQFLNQGPNLRPDLLFVGRVVL